MCIVVQPWCWASKVVIRKHILYKDSINLRESHIIIIESQNCPIARFNKYQILSPSLIDSCNIWAIQEIWFMIGILSSNFISRHLEIESTWSMMSWIILFMYEHINVLLEVLSAVMSQICFKIIIFVFLVPVQPNIGMQLIVAHCTINQGHFQWRMHHCFSLIWPRQSIQTLTNVSC